MLKLIFIFSIVILAASNKIIPARDVGVVCDGRSDDTIALNLAISSLQDGDTLELPPDSTCITTNILSITNKKDIKIIGHGPGTQIQIRRPALASIFIQDSSEIILENFKTSSPYARSLTLDRRSAGITVNASSAIFISKVTIEKSADMGIFIGDSTNIHIEDCDISDTWNNGIQIFRRSEKVTVQGCRLRNIRRDGITVTDHESGTRNKNLQILDNFILKTELYGIRLTTADDVTIKGNYVFGALYTGIQLECQPPSGFGVSNVLVTENTIEDSPREGSSHIAAALRINSDLEIMENIIITKNVIKNPRHMPNFPKCAMLFATEGSGFIHDVQVSDNIVIDDDKTVERCLNDISWAAIGHIEIKGNVLNERPCPEPPIN